MTTRLNEVIPALVVAFTAAVPTAQVYDGPRPTSEAAKEFVLVGSDGESGESVDVDQAVSDLGNRWISEAGTVTCSAWAWSGDTDITACRDTAVGLFESCEAALLADPTLGGLLVMGGFATTAPTRLSLTQSQTSEGAVVRVVFTVGYSTTLTN